MDAGGSAARPYYLFFSSVDTNLKALAAQVDALPSGGGGGGISPSANVLGVNSIFTAGTLAAGIVTVSLQNDANAVPGHYRYGSDDGGNKGWQSVASDFADTANITLSTDVNGVVSFDLTTLPDSGAGTLLAITRDTFGRITGTRAATITGTANRVTVANGTAAAGMPTIDIASTYVGQTSIITLGTVTTGTWQATAIDAAHGGTGQTTYTVGDTLYASSSTALSRLPAVATGNALISGGVGAAPSWGKVNLTTHVAGTLPIANGGTGQVTASAAFDALAPTTTSQDLIVRGASSNGRLGVGSNGQVLGISAGIVGWVTPAAGGTVTSVALTAPSQFAVGGSPITGAGTLALTWNTQTANTILAGPASGAAAAPTFRAAVFSDAPWTSDFISGVHGAWNSATSISCQSGAFITQSGDKLTTAGITKSSLVLSASTFYHVYGFNNAGTADLELSTTVPAAPYNGTARSKTGDTTRRYLFTILTDASSNVNSFNHIGSLMAYQANIGTTQFLPVSGGVATTLTNVSCAGTVPPISRIALLLALNNSTASDVAMGNASSGFTTTASAFNQYIAATKYITCAHSLDTSQQFNYLHTASPVGGFAARIQGYMFDR